MSAFLARFRRLRWYLTLTYSLATLAAIFLLSWWVLAASTLYLQRAQPDSSLVEILAGQVLPALRVILPSLAILILPALLVDAYFGFLNARWLDLRLSRLRKAAQAWKRGDFTQTVQDEVPDEIGAFGQELNAMAKELEQLLYARQELAALEERNQLARDLHDSVKQQITAAVFQIDAAKALLVNNLQAAQASLLEAENLAHSAHQELNAVIFELSPEKLRPGSLPQMLSEYCRGWERLNPIQARLQVKEGLKVDPGAQQEIFRFVQEALSNVARHSQATEVKVGLSAEGKEIRATIEDNGCGFDPKALPEEGFGLKSMRGRIQRLGGRFHVDSRLGEGTRIWAQIPIERRSDGNDR